MNQHRKPYFVKILGLPLSSPLFLQMGVATVVLPSFVGHPIHIPLKNEQDTFDFL
jgi:hypothetical protein